MSEVSVGDILARANEEPLYLKHYDPDGDEGRGSFDLIDDPNKAQVFDDFMALIECWRQTSKVLPLRADGKPNRPLTALTIEAVNADQAVLLWKTRRARA
jgi:hypothetical protein